MSKCFLLGTLILVCSCKTPVQENIQKPSDPYSKPLLEANKYMQERNREQIKAFIDRVGWQMNETESGLWYMILEPGNETRVESDNFVVYSFETKLLSGKYCYSADTVNPKKIVIGKGNVEAGIEEGLLLMHEEGSARFIIPPYLAHGNFGDRDQIPPASILLVDVQVLRVRR